MFEYRATLVSAHDGDTMRLDVDLGFDVHHASLDVRLLGLDCPELRSSSGLGVQARQFVLDWFARLGTPYVTVRTVRDSQEKYGRYLATVIGGGGASLNADLLAAGLAKPYDGSGPRPSWP